MLVRSLAGRGARGGVGDKNPDPALSRMKTVGAANVNESDPKATVPSDRFGWLSNTRG